MNPATIIFVVATLAVGAMANPNLGWKVPGAVLVQSAPLPPQDNADVQIARAAHLAEVARISNERLSALAAANARAPLVLAAAAPAVLARAQPVIVNAAPQPVQDNADVAIAKAAFLSEHARQTGNALAALAAAQARAVVSPVIIANNAGLAGLRLGAPGAVLINAAPQPVQDNADVAIAKAAHLAEHARQTGNSLAALNRVGGGWGR